MSLAPRVRRPVIGRGNDPAKGWRGADGPADRTVVRFGACEFRRMDGAHGGTTPVGYPRAACDALARDHGIRARWHNVFCMDHESLPADREGLLRHLGGVDAPDAVIVQVGAIYALRHVLGEREEILHLRDRMASRTPRGLGRVFYAGLDRALPLVGRPYRPYAGAERLRRFVAAVREQWPEALLFVELPFVPQREGLWRRALAARVRADLAAAARASGVEVVDHELRLAEAGLRCLNGYNLNGRGSARVGAFWADRLAASWG